MNGADELIQRHLHGLATAEDLEALGQLLAQSPEAADAFARATRLDHALARHHSREQKVASIQHQIRRAARRFRWVGVGAAAVLLLAVALFRVLATKEPIAYVDGRPIHDLCSTGGPCTLTFPDESTRFDFAPGAHFTIEAVTPAKKISLMKGTLRASVAPQAEPMILTTPNATARVLGTKFILSTSDKLTRLEVTEGKVRFIGEDAVEVSAGEASEARTDAKLTKTSLYEDRFAILWRELHDRARGYFSPDGLPYHSVETLIVDAPDHGHLTTSETISYWLWLEAMHGRLTGDWEPFAGAWRKMEEAFIPSAADQPTVDLYDPKKPATYAPEGDRLKDYPVALDPAVPVGADPLFAELRATYGSDQLTLMHWLVDADNVYGYGSRAFVNTFQRGPTESVWKTIPHPSKETFAFGGPNGFLDLFLKEPAYAKQWRYTGAPDADARAIQAAFWASRWAAEQGRDPATLLPLKQAARLGDSLRYALQDKYFRSRHDLIAWSAAWGGSMDRANGWAWRGGSSHVHFGYQNPVAAWALATQPGFAPASPGGAREWTSSLARQVEFYRWLQSAEGAIAGGATTSVNGRYEPVPPGTPTFHDLAYVDHPVFRDPPSNEWFGWQAWSMARLAEYVRLSGDPAARAVVDKWAAWARRVVKLDADGGYSIPSTLRWSGAPDPWNPSRPGGNAGLHVSVIGETQDVGVAAALARALIAHGAPDSRALARELLDRAWALYRDDRGVSNPEPRPDYVRFNERVELPPDWRGALASGAAIPPGATFLDLRPKLRTDPDFPKVEQAIRSGQAPVFRYHRFWAQVEIALANAEYARSSK